MNQPLRAPFPWFGGKSSVADHVWPRFGRVKQYIEPFFGSGAVLWAAPEPASLEVVNDVNGFLANFWRAVKHQPGEVARWADYPVSHIDLHARHRWLMAQRDRLGADLQDCDWPGDAKAAGWWLWGQCCWIGSGWCDWSRTSPTLGEASRPQGKVPHVSDAGRGVQAAGQVPHVGNAGMGAGAEPRPLLTSSGRVAWDWLHRLAARMERVRVVHGSWDRCLNTHYGAESTAIFLDPPYRGYESLYGCAGVADAVEAWARDNAGLRIALCGHEGDYALPGWEILPWSRGRPTYSGGKTTDAERIWFSPACLPVVKPQGDLFAPGRGAA